MSYRPYRSLSTRIPDYDSDPHDPFNGISGWAIAILLLLLVIGSCA